MRRVAVLSLHTSPLAQPGEGDGGGMNVYVRELVSALAQAGLESRVYVRSWKEDLPKVVEVEPGFSVVHIPAGPFDLSKEQLPGIVDEFTELVAEDFRSFDPQVIHANYWLSGVAGRSLKQRFDLPLVTTFHTLARVKAESGDAEPERRAQAEMAVMACADTVLANGTSEAEQLIEYYQADPRRIEIVPPGVDHAFFSQGSQAGARRAVGASQDMPLLMFVGRIQPLKGLGVAVEALARVERCDAELWVVGGASGAGGRAEVEKIEAQLEAEGLVGRVRFVPPQPHHLLSTFYRAADVCLLPSRSESFGLVALEAAACGVPVVAAAVGGLLTLVDHGRSGYLVEGRDANEYATWIDRILSDPTHARRLSVTAAARAKNYMWSTSAGRLRRLYSDLALAALAPCD